MSKYDTVGCNPMIDKPRITARFDIDKVKKVNDVNLGDTVTITITGKVRSMSGPSEHLSEDSKGKDKSYSYPGTLEVEIGEMKIYAEGEFDGLGDD
jgi:hypothetical protein